MSGLVFAPIANGGALALAQVPEGGFADFREAVVSACRTGQRLACLCADGRGWLYAVLADDAAGTLRVGRARLEGPAYPALTPDCPQAHLFEREMAEQYGLRPQGHPWLKPVRFHAPWTGRGEGSGHSAARGPAVMDFYRVGGEEVHEVAVGPVHAGVIEPGHFRFQCHGETVLHLEIALGYQHRGIERALEGGPHPLSLKQMETAAGDTSIGHAWAWCRNLEALAGVQATARAELVRGLALELERAANHTGDLGALSGDVGFLPTASFCGRIRGDWLNLSAEVCGSRLGRDWLRPGGLGHDVEPERARRMAARVEQAWVDSRDAIELLFNAASVSNRFVDTGRVDPVQAREIGLVGVAVRACHIDQDVRRNHPHGPYVDRPVGRCVAQSGTVHSRAWVRWLELGESRRFLAEALEELQGSEAEPRPGPLRALAPETLALSLVEGWRGELLHLALTDASGRLARYKIVDPSFHNWFGLALALRGEQISDFPLCNKSFNLSYCGHDL